MAESTTTTTATTIISAAATTEKDSDIPEDCDICNYAFARADHCPKILPCGHTICSDCINTLLKTNPRICPKCRKPFNGRNANDFATRMDVIDQINQCENEPEMSDLNDDAIVKIKHEDTEGNQLLKIANTLKEKTEEVYQVNLTRYVNADLDIQKEENSILELIDSLIASNVDIKSVMEVLKEVVAKNTNTISYLKKVKQILQNRQNVRAERVKTNEENGMKIHLCHDLSSIGYMAQKFKELNQNAKEFEQDLKKLVTKSEENRISIQKEHKRWRENLDKIQAIPSFKKGGDVLQSIQLNLSQELAEMKSGYDVPIHLKVDDIREMSDLLRRQIEGGKVHARQIRKGELLERFGRLSFSEDGELLLHHLTERSRLPFDSHVIKYSEILKMVDPSCRQTFIDFERGNQVGRTFFHLSPDTGAAKQFFLMCSGEIGTSYAGIARQIVIHSRGSGINESLNINTDESLLKLDWKSELKKAEYTRPQVAGSLFGYHFSDNFNGIGIYTKDLPQGRHVHRPMFGKVCKGLDVVEKLCSTPRKKDWEPIDCRIKDCGVVIRTS